MHDIANLPTWLPDKVKKAINDEFSNIENEKYKNDIDKKWQFIKVIFVSKELKKIWEKLSSYSEEDIDLFISQIFDLPHNWKKELERMEKKKRYEKNIIKSINKLLKAKADLDKLSLYKDGEVETAWKLIDSRLLERLYIIKKQKDPNHADYYLSLFSSPSTRKKNVTNAHAIYCMRYLSLSTRTAFNKPMIDLVTNFVNAIFDTEYAYNDIVGYTKDIKRISEKLNNVNIPFASTVDLKTGKIRLVDSKE